MADELAVDDFVVKTGGDYTFHGWVVAVFRKRGTTGQGDGPVRYVVEDGRGLLMIMSPGQLTPGAGS